MTMRPVWEEREGHYVIMESKEIYCCPKCWRPLKYKRSKGGLILLHCKECEKFSGGKRRGLWIKQAWKISYLDEVPKWAKPG